MIYPIGTVLFSGSYPEHTEAAREYIAEKKLTADDVKIVRREDIVFIITKKPMEI